MSNGETQGERRKRQRDLAADLDYFRRCIERHIDLTPTSELRNALTDVNIHLMRTQDINAKFEK